MRERRFDLNPDVEAEGMPIVFALYSPRRLPACQPLAAPLIVQIFKVTAGLDETVFDEGDDLRPQSMQPVIYTNDDGERQIELMLWAFNLPDRLLFNARSEGIDHAKFWKDAFQKGRCICRATPSTNGRKSRKKRRSRSMCSPFPDNIPSAWLRYGSSGRT